MVLYVSNKCAELDFGLGIIGMTVNEFVDIKNHPYIATSGIEYAVVELVDSIPVGLLRNVIKKVRIIPKIDGEISNKMVTLLAELYPENAAELRFAFLRDKAKLVTIVTELREKFEWDKFYIQE